MDSDPHNVGACGSAAAADVDRIVQRIDLVNKEK